MWDSPLSPHSRCFGSKRGSWEEEAKLSARGRYSGQSRNSLRAIRLEYRERSSPVIQKKCTNSTALSKSLISFAPSHSGHSTKLDTQVGGDTAPFPPRGPCGPGLFPGSVQGADWRRPRGPASGVAAGRGAERGHVTAA